MHLIIFSCHRIALFYFFHKCPHSLLRGCVIASLFSVDTWVFSKLWLLQIMLQVNNLVYALFPVFAGVFVGKIPRSRIVRSKDNAFVIMMGIAKFPP